MMRGEIAFLLCLAVALSSGCARPDRIARACAKPSVAALLDESEDVLVEALDRGVEPGAAALRIASRVGWAGVVCVVDHLLADPPAELAGPGQPGACHHRRVRRALHPALRAVRDLALRRL